MGGLLKRNAAEWEHIKALEAQVTSLTEAVASLQQEIASFRGRIRSCENTGASANARCERIETRVGKLEVVNPMARVAELPTVARDQEPPVKHKTCATCRGNGTRIDGGGPNNLCPSCDGRGYIEVVP